MPRTNDDGRNEKTTSVAAIIVDKERAERAAKTARLKEARLAQAITPGPIQRKPRITKKIRRIFVAG
ncbi:hypothetical protein [Mesorhizobium sp. CO1-1-8]|uniref:hypothetical protein n=1 Tax=Mesorhizobium sp. CO1-1-8 TaxID=2876631 RepID=UPI001CD129C9|nr:hypothetical protein [Mesorhizobium sp. CO1-1-8]MBZ9773303.1 hypothetical protein [Mesorhizobium sp. CO1-1-8]